MVDDIDAPGNIAGQLQRGLLMGSVAEEIMRQSAVPVVLVPQHG